MSIIEPSQNGAGKLSADPVIKPYNPATQHRVVDGNLQALDMINERFARNFRTSLFQLLRRGADIAVHSSGYLSTSEFESQIESGTNLNMVTMKPLRGHALIAFSAETVYTVVDHRFGGAGKDGRDNSPREFSPMEYRVIQDLLKHAMEAYEKAWESVFPVEVNYVRSETQAKFTNITNSSNELVQSTNFILDVGSFSGRFSITLPYPMIEPIKAPLSNMVRDQSGPEQDNWDRLLSSEIMGPVIELVTDFAYIDTTLSQVMALKVGDVLPIQKPDIVTSRVHGIPVMKSEYGNLDENTLALRVKELINHKLLHNKPDPRFVKGIAQEIKEIV